MDEVARLAREHRPEADHRRLVGLPAAARLRRVPPDRRRGRRLPDGGHGALRRPGRRRAAPVPGAARARRHLTTHKTLGGPRGGFILTNEPDLAQEDQLRGLPRPAGRPAGARDRGQGRGVQDGRRAGVRRPAAAHAARAPASSPTGCCRPDVAPRAGSTCSPAAPTCTWCWSTCGPRSWTASRPRTGCTAVGITVNRNAVPFDPRPPMVTSGLRIGTPALATRGFGDAEFAEVADIIAAALRPSTDDAGARRACATRSPRWPRSSRSTRPWRRRPMTTVDSGPVRPGADLPEHPDFLWRNPEPKRSLRRGDRRRRRPRPGHRALPGQEPRHHQRRRAGEGLAGRRQHGPQHHDHPLQLPVGRERRHLRALPQAVGGPRGRSRLPDPVQPARRAQPRAQPAGRPRQRPPGRGQPAQRHRRRMGRRPTRSRSSARSSTSRHDIRYPVLGATYQPRAGIAKHDYVPGASPAAPTRPASTSSRTARSPASTSTATGSPACGPPAATSPPAGSAALRGRPHLRARRHARASTCRCRATRCRRWSPSCSSRCTPPW